MRHYLTDALFRAEHPASLYRWRRRFRLAKPSTGRHL